MENEIKTQLITEVARIIGLPIIPMAPTAVHDSKPFPHLVRHGNGRLFLEGQLFDPLANPQHFLLVEAWLERSGLAYRHEFAPGYGCSHMFQIESGMSFIFDKRPLAGCMALVHQFGDAELETRYFAELVLEKMVR